MEKAAAANSFVIFVAYCGILRAGKNLSCLARRRRVCLARLTRGRRVCFVVSVLASPRSTRAWHVHAFGVSL